MLRVLAIQSVFPGQSPISTSPGPRKRPVQVSESVDADLPDGRTIEKRECDERQKCDNDDRDDNDGNRKPEERKVEGAEKEEQERSRSTVGAPIELQVAFNSNVFIDVDPDSDPVVLTNLTLRHLPSPGGGGGGGDGARSQDSSPSSRVIAKSNNGSFNDGVGGNNEELICVMERTP